VTVGVLDIDVFDAALVGGAAVYIDKRW